MTPSNSQALRGFLRPAILVAAACLLIASTTTTRADIPANYYDTVDTTNGTTLRNSLNAIVTSGHSISGVNFNNSTLSFAALRRVDADHGDPTFVQLLYATTRIILPHDPSQDGDYATGGWNREHTWPQSFFDSNNPMVSDLHALFPEDADINNRRNNSPFDVVVTPTVIDVFGNKSTTSLFEPRDAKKGDVARAILYMDLRYDGTNGSEPDLGLTNDTGLLGTGNHLMAVRDTLLQWHNADPPDAWEVLRNHRVYDEQGNANPFVDHPEWVPIIYGSASPTVANGDTIGTSFTSLAPATAEQGDTDIPVLRMTLTLAANQYDVESFALTRGGTLSDAYVSNVKLWLDRDASDTVSLNDMLLATGTFSGGTASLTNYAPLRLAPGSTRVLVTASLNPIAPVGATLQVGVAANGITHSPRGGADVDPTFAATASNALEVTGVSGGGSTGVNIVMVSPRGSDNAAAKEFLVLANGSPSPVSLANWELRSRAGASTSTSTMALSGIIPARGHFIVYSQGYGPGPSGDSVEGVAGDLMLGNANGLFGGMADTTARSIALFDDGGTKVDGFSYNGGATNPLDFNDGTPFAGALSSATTQVYARKRPGVSVGNYTDTDENVDDLEILTTKTPPSDLAVPVELSGFAID